MVMSRNALIGVLLLLVAGTGAACRTPGMTGAATRPATILSLDRQDGEERWRVEAEADWITDVALGDALLVLGYDACPAGGATLTSYDPASGEVFWTRDVLGAGCNSREQLAVGDRAVVVCSPDAGLEIWAGREQSAQTFDHRTCASAELGIGNGIVLSIEQWSGDAVAFDIVTGVHRWAAEIPAFRELVAIDGNHAVVSTGDALGFRDQPVILRGIDLGTGHEAWSLDVGILERELLSASSDGVVVVAVRRDSAEVESELLGIDVKTGVELWRHHAQSIAALDADAGTLYAIWDGVLYPELPSGGLLYVDAIDIRTGNPMLVMPATSVGDEIVGLSAHADGVAVLDRVHLTQFKYSADLDPIRTQQGFPRNRVLDHLGRTELVGLEHLAADADGAYAVLQGHPRQQDY
jgi:outer membrane protein assembly factor BamB